MKYEYKVSVFSQKEFQEQLNAMGKSGWSLVNYHILPASQYDEQKFHCVFLKLVDVLLHSNKPSFDVPLKSSKI